MLYFSKFRLFFPILCISIDIVKTSDSERKKNYFEYLFKAVLKSHVKTCNAHIRGSNMFESDEVEFFQNVEHGCQPN